MWALLHRAVEGHYSEGNTGQAIGSGTELIIT